MKEYILAAGSDILREGPITDLSGPFLPSWLYAGSEAFAPEASQLHFWNELRTSPCAPMPDEQD
jgi:hypothetical protein